MPQPYLQHACCLAARGLISSNRDAVDTQVTMRNATFTLTQSEYIYFTLWALVVTTDVATVSEQAQELKSATSIVKVR